WQFRPGSDSYSGDSCNLQGGQIRTVYLYDGAANGKGRLQWTVTADFSEQVVAYDARGRTQTTVKNILQPGGPTRSFQTGFVYDEADRLTQVSYPTSVDNTVEWLLYAYNFAGQLVKASTPGNVYVNNANYDRFGRLTELTQGVDAWGAPIVAQDWIYSNNASE